MSRAKLIVIAAAGILLASQFSWGTTAAVGHCKPTLIHFATIQDAVDAVPAGSTIYVCSGTYPEQVSISQNLTLTGVADGSQDAPVITAPAGGLVQNTTSVYTGVPIAAQIWVNNTAGPVNINNLTVDAANGSNSCNLSPVGIMYENASGIVSHVATRNQIMYPYSVNGGCQGGYGIFVQTETGTSTVAVNSSTVHNFQKNGIVAQQPGSTLTAAGNTVLGFGPTSGAAQNGIEIAFGATGKVTGNSVSDFNWSPDTFTDPGDAATGILIYNSTATITGNTVANAQFGIGVVESGPGLADSNAVTGNKVYGTHLFDGIDVCSDHNTVQHNIVNSSDEAGIHNDSTCTGSNTGNTISYNTINEACAGLLTGVTPQNNTLFPNTFFNVGTTLDPGDSCEAPVFSSSVAPATLATQSKHLAVRP